MDDETESGKDKYDALAPYCGTCGKPCHYHRVKFGIHTLVNGQTVPTFILVSNCCNDSLFGDEILTTDYEGG